MSNLNLLGSMCFVIFNKARAIDNNLTQNRILFLKNERENLPDHHSRGQSSAWKLTAPPHIYHLRSHVGGEDCVGAPGRSPVPSPHLAMRMWVHIGARLGKKDVEGVYVYLPPLRQETPPTEIYSRNILSNIFLSPTSPHTRPPTHNWS